MTGPRAWRGSSSRSGAALDHETAAAHVDRVFITAHPAEPTAVVLLRAGEAALVSYVEDVLRRPALRSVGPGEDDRKDDSVVDGEIAVEPLRRLFARHLRDRSPDDPDGELYAAVVAGAVVAALDLALRTWLADGARADAVPACRERLRAVGELLPPAP